jgi:hypothetical protein
MNIADVVLIIFQLELQLCGGARTFINALELGAVVQKIINL